MNINRRTVGEVSVFDIEGKLDTQTSTPALEELLEQVGQQVSNEKELYREMKELLGE